MKDKKHLFLKLLCFTFMLGSTAAGAAACSDKPADSSKPEGYDKTFSDVGSYYADEGTTRNTFDLTDSSFTLKLGDQTITGTYLYNGTVLRLVTTDGTIVEATYSEAAIKFTYGGKTYTFIKNVEYTVSFEMNGGSAQADVKVLNGKTIDKPADPVKTEEGKEYGFIGWYKDAEFKEKFSFDSVIRKDTKVYARFVELLSSGEYSVSFYGYDNLNMKTIGGKLFGLDGANYVLPDKDGAKFLGWWYSSYNDENKLTAQCVNEDSIEENVVLYPVWENANKPAVSVSAEKISITGNATEVSVYKVKDSGEFALVEKVAVSTLDFSFEGKEAGDYIVVAKNGTEETSAYYAYKKLARVCLFDIEEPSVLRFVPVEGAQKYLLKIECGTENHTNEVIDLGTKTYYDFSACSMSDDDTIAFTVTAVAGEGYLDSVSSRFVTDRKLETPANFVADKTNAKLTWDKVSFADYYLLTVNDKEVIRIEKDQTSYDLKDYAKGSYSFSLVAVGKSFNNSSAAVTTWMKTTLAAPKNVYLDGGSTIKWNAVQGATGYTVSINGTEFSVSGTSKQLTAEMIGDNSSCEIFVRADSSDSGTESSVYSDMLEVNASAIDEVRYEDGVLSWNPVFGVTKYDVKVNDGDVTQITGTSAKITFTQAGNNALSVRSYDADGVASDWVTKTVVAYTVSYNVSGSEKTIADAYLAEGDSIALPTPDYNGYNFSGWYDGVNGTGNKYESDYGVLPTFDADSDLTLYAKWDAKTYTVSFDGGTYSATDLSDGATVRYRQSDFVLPTPESSNVNMAFAGWYYGTQKIADQNGAAVGEWNYLGGKLLTARWVEIFKYGYSDAVNGYVVMASKTGVQYLSELKIPETYNNKPVKRLAAGALDGCSHITKISLPAGIAEIETSALDKCTSLKEIEIYGTSADAVFSSEDGVLIKGDTLMYIPKGKTGDVYTVSSSVKTIYSGVFENRKFETICIPASVTTIEASAFSHNPYVKKIEFLAADDGVAEESLTIESGAFTSCNALEEIALPARVSEMTLWNGTTENIFSGCYSLNSISVTGNTPAGVTAAYSSSDGILLSADGTTLLYYPRGKREENVTIPGTVTKIAEKAFYYCYASTLASPSSIVISDKITSIGDSAFEGCSSLKITFAEEISADSPDLSIGARAFYGAKAIASDGKFTLPVNVKTIGAKAFGAADITELTVNSSGTLNFASGAFVDNSNYNSLKTLHIGADFSSVNIASVFGSSNTTTSVLSTVDIAEGNANYANGTGETDKDIVYNSNFTSILFVPVSKAGAYVMPGTITEIAENTFAGREKLTSITIGAGVTFIGDNAFKGCIALETVAWAERSENVSIGEYAFYDCRALETITFPAQLETIGEGAFEECEMLGTISFATGISGVKIGERAFYGCDELTDVTLPEGIVAIGNAAFADCDSLTSLSIPASAIRLGDGDYDEELDEYDVYSVFLFSESGTSSVSSSVKNVTVAKDNKFFASDSNGMLYNKDCSVLYFCPYAFAPTDGAITLASTLTSIGQYAFANCTGVKTIAFADGASVSSFSIGSNAFQNATNLSSFALPSGLKTIAANTFSGCESLKKIVVPNTVTLIQAGAFAGCTGLEEVEFEEGGTEALVLADGSSSGGGGWYSSSTTTGVFSSYTSGGRGGYPWGGGGSTQNKSCTSLKKVAFPKRLTQIGAYAFAKCTALQEVTFGDDSDLETIGAYAFRESGLQKIGKFTTTSKKVTDEDGEEEEVFYTTSTLPAKLKTIGESAFYSVSFAENTTLVIPASVESFGGSSPQYGVFYQGGSNLKSVVFEDGSKLTKVPQNAFMATQGLESVDFGDNGALDEIAYNAFYTCRQLKSVDFGENGKLRVIGKSAFAYTALESISIPATVEIVGDPSISYGYGVFAGCEKLTAVTFETYADGDNKGKSSLETICEGAFQNTALTSFTFPSTIKGLAAGTSGGLGKGLFSGCTKLTEITLSDTVTDLSDVFTGCSSIEKISGDNANYTFEDHILYGVSEGKKTEIVMLIGNLSTTEGTLTIADGITKIGASVFAGRADVKKLVLPASLTTIGENTFKDCVGLQEVTFAENCALNSIGASAFKNCISLKSISLPSGVTALEDNTFYHCSSLTSVKMPGVTRIGSEPDESSWSVPDSNVFAFCSSLSTIDLKNVTTIGKRSFEKCVSLTDIDLSSATEIGEAEFIGCSSLESVKVGDGLTSIPASAFQNCSKLKYFGIIVDKTKDPIVDLSSVTSIDNGAFVNNSSITEVKLSANEGFTELSASLFKGCTSLAYVNKTNTGTEEKPVYTSYLPNQLTTLGNEAFADSALTSVRIPDGVTAIGYDSWNISYATGRTFAGCTKLTDLDLNNVTIICAESFIDCPLTNVKDTLLSKVQWFGKGSFARTGLKTADLSGVKTTYNSWGVQTPMGFEDGSFGSYNLSHSDYSDGVFEDCKSLASVIFSSDTEDVTIGGSTVSVNIQLGKAMFKGCTALTSVTLTKGVTSLAGGTFYGCSNLEKVNVDENGEISNVGSYTFGNCVKLGSFDISKVGSLSEGLFDGCEKLTTVTMNYGVNSIPAYVFRNCKALTSIDFTQFSGVSSIGESAFEGCSSLTGHLKLPKGQSQPTYDESTGEFTWKIGTYSVGENAFKGTGFASLYVSASVSSIGEDAFAECKNLTGIEVDAENKYFATGEDDGWLYDLDLTEIVLIPSGYNPEGNVLTLTGDMTLTANALNSCPNITKVVLDESITSVPEDLFKGSLYVKEVVLSSKTTSIGMHAFANSSVEKISYTGYTGDSAGEKTAVLPETVTSISSYAFLGSKIEKVVADGLTSIGTGAFANSALKQITYSDYVAEEGETLLVSSFKNLTSISGSAFRGTKLEKVILPASTRSVNSGAFANSELQSIVFSADNISFYYQNETVYGFGYPGVFENCAKLSNVTFGKDQGSLDDRMFCGCSSLASITIPEKVTSLGGYMFYGCSNLASVTLPANLRSIGEYAFYGCAFTSIKIPEGVTNISAHAFENCSNLTSIDVPASARWLYYTFVNCTSLETVVLHEGLDTLGQSVFEGCTALKNITLPSTLKTIQNFVFNDCTSLKSIVLPASLTTVYFSFENWTSDQTIYIEASDMQVYGTWSGNSNGSYDSFMQQTSDNSDYRKFGATIVWNYKAPASESDSESATDSSESAATDSSESDES